MSGDLVAQLRDVSVSYGTGTQRVEALKNVSLDIRAASSTAVIGRSGSGKSTLMGILSGLRSPHSGDAHLPSAGPSNRAVTGVVFQSFHLDSHLTPIENCMLPWFVRGGMTRRQATANAARLLEQVGLGLAKSRTTATLSGGERQRVAIARALFYEPRLLVADEPTGNLDEATSKTIQELLFGIPRRYPESAVVVVTHDPLVAAGADRIVELSAGAITGIKSLPTAE